MTIATIPQLMAGLVPVTNVPELLGLQHSNPLGLPVWLLLGLAVALAAALIVVNYGIRYREKSGRYPLLYGLMAALTVVLYYYCFWQQERGMGWFCKPDVIGWGWGLLGVALGTFVLWALATALMQSMAQLSVGAGMVEGKPWKEWKVAVHILNLGALATSILYFFEPGVSAWVLVVTLALIGAFCLCKMVADGLRFGAWGWAVVNGLVFLLVSMALLMLTLEVLRGFIFVALFVVAILVGARARQKKIKK